MASKRIAEHINYSTHTPSHRCTHSEVCVCVCVSVESVLALLMRVDLGSQQQWD